MVMNKIKLFTSVLLLVVSPVNAQVKTPMLQWTQTLAEWASESEAPYSGEWVCASDVLVGGTMPACKVGDGVTLFPSLPWATVYATTTAALDLDALLASVLAIEPVPAQASTAELAALTATATRVYSPADIGSVFTNGVLTEIVFADGSRLFEDAGVVKVEHASTGEIQVVGAAINEPGDPM